MSTSILDLPPELLPDILRHLVRRQDLYNVSLVNRDWSVIGQKLLYRWIRLFGKDLVSLITAPRGSLADGKMLLAGYRSSTI